MALQFRLFHDPRARAAVARAVARLGWTASGTAATSPSRATGISADCMEAIRWSCCPTAAALIVHRVEVAVDSGEAVSLPDGIRNQSDGIV